MKGILPGGLPRISSDGDDRRIFWGFKFSILELFWVRKFGKYFFGVAGFKQGFFGVLKGIGSALAT